MKEAIVEGVTVRAIKNDGPPKELSDAELHEINKRIISMFFEENNMVPTQIFMLMENLLTTLILNLNLDDIDDARQILDQMKSYILNNLVENEDKVNRIKMRVHSGSVKELEGEL